VKSPTFTLVESYEFGADGAAGRPELRAVHHFDLYRLGDPAELHGLGFEDYQQADALCLIEWPSRGGALPDPAVRVELQATGPVSRRLTLVLGPGVSEEKVAEFEALVADIR
jgi:tRNA threonylcarbamoyladenosine biosynthesis protein TsaE